MALESECCCSVSSEKKVPEGGVGMEYFPRSLSKPVTPDTNE